MPNGSRCIRCLAAYSSPPYLMAGRPFCCQSCSVGSACEHQGVTRAANVRRFDSNFVPFRQAARHSSPYETTRIEEHSDLAINRQIVDAGVVKRFVDEYDATVVSGLREDRPVGRYD